MGARVPWSGGEGPALEILDGSCPSDNAVLKWNQHDLGFIRGGLGDGQLSGKMEASCWWYLHCRTTQTLYDDPRELQMPGSCP